MMVHACNSSIQEAEVASLLGHFLKKKKKNPHQPRLMGLECTLQ